MKDHLTAILEAVRLSQAVLVRPDVGRSAAEATVGKLKSFLNDQRVVAAMDALYPNVKSPVMGEDVSVSSERIKAKFN